jgi:MOSC domain-containing protein YiiM
MEVTLDCDPCEFIERMRPGLQAAMQGRRGTLFRVIESGQVSIGDPVAVLVREPAI